jgi:hypothetical protein
LAGELVTTDKNSPFIARGMAGKALVAGPPTTLALSSKANLDAWQKHTKAFSFDIHVFTSQAWCVQMPE